MGSEHYARSNRFKLSRSDIDPNEQRKSESIHVEAQMAAPSRHLVLTARLWLATTHHSKDTQAVKARQSRSNVVLPRSTPPHADYFWRNDGDARRCTRQDDGEFSREELSVCHRSRALQLALPATHIGHPSHSASQWLLVGERPLAVSFVAWYTSSPAGKISDGYLSGTLTVAAWSWSVPECGKVLTLKSKHGKRAVRYEQNAPEVIAVSLGPHSTS